MVNLGNKPKDLLSSGIKCLTQKLALSPFGFTVFTILTSGYYFGCNLVINYI